MKIFVWGDLKVGLKIRQTNSYPTLFTLKKRKMCSISDLENAVAWSAICRQTRVLKVKKIYDKTQPRTRYKLLPRFIYIQSRN
jgi:hypothetical protein